MAKKTALVLYGGGWALTLYISHYYRIFTARVSFKNGKIGDGWNNKQLGTLSWQPVRNEFDHSEICCKNMPFRRARPRASTAFNCTVLRTMMRFDLYWPAGRTNEQLKNVKNTMSQQLLLTLLLCCSDQNTDFLFFKSYVYLLEVQPGFCEYINIHVYYSIPWINCWCNNDTVYVWSGLPQNERNATYATQAVREIIQQIPDKEYCLIF